MTFPEYLHRQSGGEITGSLNQQIAVTSLYLSVYIKVLPSSYNYRQMHHIVINGSSCSRTDCKMVISCGDLQRTVTRQIFVLGISFKKPQHGPSQSLSQPRSENELLLHKE